jgi:cytochrome c biogenesis protein CcdA
MLEILIAILAGILTVGAPCILPLLPILLGTSIGQTSKTRPFFIIFGFILSFTIVGISLSFLVSRLGLQPDTIRTIAVILLGLFGLFMVWPIWFEKLTVHINRLVNKTNEVGTSAGSGNKGGFILGLTLGIIWTPCAGPVLGSILTLIATQTNLTEASILLFAYAIGAGIPMLIIAYGSQVITTKVRFLAQYSRAMQQIFGVIIILVAIAIHFQYDTVIQSKLLDIFPSWNFANSSIFYK